MGGMSNSSHRIDNKYLSHKHTYKVAGPGNSGTIIQLNLYLKIIGALV